MNLPQDPNMLMSVINMKLRDEYPDFQSMCAALDLDAEEIKRNLASAGYHYDINSNRFM